MVKRCSVIASIVPWAAVLLGAEPSTPPAKPDKGLVVQTFKLLLSRDGTELGTFSVTSRLAGPYLSIVEEAKIAVKGRRESGWRTEARYQLRLKPPDRPALKILQASVTTTIGGKPCMKGTVGELAEGKDGLEADVAATVLTDGDGKPLDPPKEIKKPLKVGRELPVIQTAILPLGCRLLAEPGELKDICFVEFPDDIDSPANAKAGYRLVREAADATGSFWVKLFAPKGEEPVVAIQYDKQNLVLAATLFKFKLVPAKK